MPGCFEVGLSTLKVSIVVKEGGIHGLTLGLVLELRLHWLYVLSGRLVQGLLMTLNATLSSAWADLKVIDIVRQPFILCSFLFHDHLLDRLLHGLPQLLSLPLLLELLLCQLWHGSLLLFEGFIVLFIDVA